MKTKLFITISILSAVFLFGCDLNMANDPLAKAALTETNVTTTTTFQQPAVAVVPAITNPAPETPAAPAVEIEIPVTFQSEVEIPVLFE